MSRPVRPLLLAAGLFAWVSGVATADSLRLYASGAYWLAVPSGTMTITEGGRAGRRIDLSDDLDLGLGNEGGGSFAAELGRHRFGISYQPLSFGGDAKPATDLVFHGSTFAAGAPVQSDVRLRLIVPHYDYTLLASSATTLRLGLDAYVWTFDAKLRGATLAGESSEQRSFTHVLPALAASIEYPLASWQLSGQASFGMIGSDRYAVDAASFLSRDLGRFLEVSWGYRCLDFVFHETTNRGALLIHGPFLSLTLRLEPDPEAGG